MRRYYCTYFDRNYLLKALALIESLARHETRPYQLFAVCMDEITRLLLGKLSLPNVVLIPIHEIEEGDEALLAAKRNRNLVEYYWTVTSTALLWILEKHSEVDVLTYLDADLYFFSSPEPVFEELGSKSVLIHEHRFPSRLVHLEKNGKFNVGLMCFRNDHLALGTLRWWRERCLEWCYQRNEAGKFGDQCYLDDWPERFQGVVVLQSPGAGLAPWNHEQYEFSVDPVKRPLVDGRTVVFYHFHGFELVHPEVVLPIKHKDYPLTPDLLNLCFLPYAEALLEALRTVRQVLPDFGFGISSVLVPDQTFLARKTAIEKLTTFRASHTLLDLNERWCCFASGQLVGRIGSSITLKAAPGGASTATGEPARATEWRESDLTPSLEPRQPRDTQLNAQREEAVRALVETAKACVSANRIEEFESALAKALELDPNSRSALKLLADVNLRMERFQDAARFYGRIFKQTPDDLEILIPLGIAFYKAGDLETASTVFERALVLDPDNTAAKENLKVIQSQPPGATSSAKAVSVKSSTPVPLVSAIVSTYNSEAFIRNCLRDLVSQTLYQKGLLEIMVIDSGSEQNERAVVQEFQKNHSGITYLRTARETVYASWNRGIDLARGRYVTNANTDDAHRPDALERLAAELEKSPNADLAYGDFVTTSSPNDSFANPQAVRRIILPPYEPATLMFYCVTGCHPMWRKSVFERIGRFDTSFKSAGDYEFVLRLAKAGFVAAHVPEILSLYYLNPRGIQFGSWKENLEESNQVRAKYRAEMPLDRLFQINPRDPASVAGGWINLGNLAMKHEIPWFDQLCSDYDYAACCYEQALKVIPGNLAALRNLIILRTVQERVPECEPIYAQLPTEQATALREALQKGQFELTGFDLAPAGRMALPDPGTGEHPIGERQPARTDSVTAPVSEAPRLGAASADSSPLPSVSSSFTQAQSISSREAPLVSAILSTYNSERFIRGCLQDLVDQTLYANGRLEIVVIDSGSEEKEAGIVEEFQRRYPGIRYQRTERETLYAAWNRAVKLATGKYVTPANTDDRHRRDALEKMARILEETKVGMVYADVMLTSVENETFDRNTAQRIWELPDYSMRQTLMHQPFSPKDMWPRRLHEEIGLFDPTFSIAGDYEFFIRLARRYGAYHINEPLGLYFESQKNLSYGDQAKVKEEVNRFIGRYRTSILLEEIYPFLKEDQTPTARVVALVDWANHLAWLAGYPGLDVAEQLYRQAIAVEGSPTAGIQNNLALLSYRRGQRSAAIELLRKIPAADSRAIQNLKELESGNQVPKLQLFKLRHAGLDRMIPALPSLGKRIPATEYWRTHGKSDRPRPTEPDPLDKPDSPIDRNPKRTLAADRGDDRLSAGGNSAKSARKLGGFRVVWCAPIFDPSGYANEARHFVLNLEEIGHDVVIRPVGSISQTFREHMPRDMRDKLDSLLQKNVTLPFLCVEHSPGYLFKRHKEAAYCIGRTMFESDGVPEDWVSKCNQMDEIWVPSEITLQSFRDAGVKVPLVKIPEGVDTERFRPGLEPLRIPGVRGTVFLSIFEWIYRKGWDVLIRAWATAFRPDENVSLVLRSYPLDGADIPDVQMEIEDRINRFLAESMGLKRENVAPIVVLGNQIPDEEMPRLYAAANAYVSPSRGEGWGRTPIEAMASGLPTIATGWGGTREFMTDENSLPLDYAMVDIDERCEIPFYRGHRWAEPSVEHLVRVLRRVAEQPEESAKIGSCARQDMVKHWQWDRVAGLAADRLRHIAADLQTRRSSTPSRA